MVRSLSKDVVCRMQGNVLIHIEFAIKQDQELGRSFLKMMKTYFGNISPFMIGVLLTISKIPTFTQIVYKLLKQKIDESYQESVRHSLFKIDKGIELQ